MQIKVLHKKLDYPPQMKINGGSMVHVKCFSEKDYRTTIDFFMEIEAEFYKYRLQSERSLNMVLRWVPYVLELEEISKELREYYSCNPVKVVR